MTWKQIFLFFMWAFLAEFAVFGGVMWYKSRPLTCETGMMKWCPGHNSIQFCQYDHYTPCFKREVDHTLGVPEQGKWDL